MSTVMGIVTAVIIFMAIILLHEFGHLLMAKVMNVGVIEYSVGMGPLLFSKRIGDTVYSLRVVPFGGYCAMYGEDELQDDGGKRKTPDYKTDWTHDESIAAKPAWKRLLIFLAGPVMNFLLGAVACFIMIMAFPFAGSPYVSEVIPGTPAAESGILDGDVIIAVNGRRVMTWDDYSEYMASHSSVTSGGFTVTVSRDGQREDINAVHDPETGLFGITVSFGEAAKTPVTVPAYLVNRMVYMVHNVTDSIGMLFRGDASVNDMSGIVGAAAVITETVGEAVDAEDGSPGMNVMWAVLYLTALFSINLGIFNLFPFPALDGGRCLSCLIEMISGKCIPERVEWAVNTAGLTVLMVFMVYLTVKDVAGIISRIL